MSEELNKYLFDLIINEMSEFPDVQTGKFFGLDVLKFRDRTFSMIWKEGRVGVKILDKELNQKLALTKGANHWVTSGKTMSQWVLAPHEFNEDIISLKKWLVLAYTDASENIPH